MKEHTKAIQPPATEASRAHNCSPTCGLTPFRFSHGTTIKPTRKDSAMRKQIVMEMIKHRLQLVAARTMFCAVLAGAVFPCAQATTITVTNTEDGGPGSLRAALAAANDGDSIDATGVS